MMAGRKKWVTVAAIVLSATLGWYACAKIRYQLELPLYQMASCLRLYIREFHTFPQSRDDLIQKGYLKIDRSDGQESYSVRFDLVEAITRKTTDKTVSTTWYEIDFSSFTLRYGAAVDTLFLKEGVLYQKSDGKPVLLFDGPRKWLLSGTYSRLSAELYREMKNVKEVAENGT